MEVFVCQLCRAYFQDHPDICQLGRTATFGSLAVVAENRNIPVGVANLRYTFVHCRLEYRVGSGVGRVSGKMLVKYFESQQQAPGAADGFASFEREIDFFRTALPILKRHKAIPCVPKLCASRVTATGDTNQKAFLFECPAGVINFACCSFLGEAHLSVMVRHIANLHAAYWLACKADPNFWPGEQHLHLPFAKPERVLPLLKRCLDPIDVYGQYIESHINAKERLRQMLNDFNGRLQAPFSVASRNACWTMCHQSYSQNNVVFEHYRHIPTQLRVFNWQSVGFASLGVDLVIVMLVEQKARRAQVIPKLVQEYRAALHEIPVAERPSVAAIFVEIRRCIPVALYVLASRVLRATSQTQPDSSLFPVQLWNEELILNLYRFMIMYDFV